MWENIMRADKNGKISHYIGDRSGRMGRALAGAEQDAGDGGHHQGESVVGLLAGDAVHAVQAEAADQCEDRSRAAAGGGQEIRRQAFMASKQRE